MTVIEDVRGGEKAQAVALGEIACDVRMMVKIRQGKRNRGYLVPPPTMAEV